MLKRLYVNNYKSLVNFELHFDDLNVLIGPNGAGKTAVFEALRMVRRFLTSTEAIHTIFKRDHKTRWVASPQQRFELDISGNEGLYRYSLSIEFGHRDQMRVSKEELTFNGNPLIRFEDGDVQLYRDDHSKGPTFSTDWAQSALRLIAPRHDNTLLSWFKRQVELMLIVHPFPPLMGHISDAEMEFPTYDMSNFVSWYRYLSQDQGITLQLNQVLRDVLPQFNYFNFEKYSADRRALNAVFTLTDDQTTQYPLTDLSDGQRMLIALYTLVYAHHNVNYRTFEHDGTGYIQEPPRLIICVDEPENYVALPEIQRVLREFQEAREDQAVQTLLISHHPTTLNYFLVEPIAYWLERDGEMQTRARRVSMEADDTGLTPAELVEREWLDG